MGKNIFKRAFDELTGAIEVGKYLYRTVNGSLQVQKDGKWVTIPADPNNLIYRSLYNQVNLQSGIRRSMRLTAPDPNDTKFNRILDGMKLSLIGSVSPSGNGLYSSVSSPKDAKVFHDWVKNYTELAKRWYERQLDKKADEPSLKTLKYEDTYDAPDSEYYTQRPSITGDTLVINDKVPGRYYMLESYNLNDVRLNYRNRGDFSPINNTEGAIITSFDPFVPYERVTDKNKTYIGIDRFGRFKAGGYSDFGPGDIMTRSFSNNVTNFVRNPDGTIKLTDKYGSGYRMPVAHVIEENGLEKDGHPVNLMTRHNDFDPSKYGKIAGGRVIMKAGNDFRLVSGSINDIAAAFEDMKNRNNVPYVTFYTMDNGSYNVGLRTKSKNFTPSDLLYYDTSNASGGHFLYLLPDQNIFNSDTTLVKNVRTENDESYKNGHPLTNQLRGIVNHHTGFYGGGSLAVIRDFLDSYGTNNARSSHVVIDRDGTRHILADPSKVTFHGGYSRWANLNNVNDFMLGVEFFGDTNQQDLTPEQILSYIEYVKPIIREHQIPFENIVTHQLIRDEYNKWARENGEEVKPEKHDVNEANLRKLLDELLRLVYVKKRRGGRLLLRNPIKRFKK